MSLGDSAPSAVSCRSRAETVWSFLSLPSGDGNNWVTRGCSCLFDQSRSGIFEVVFNTWIPTPPVQSFPGISCVYEGRLKATQNHVLGKDEDGDGGDGVDVDVDVDCWAWLPRACV